MIKDQIDRSNMLTPTTNIFRWDINLPFIDEMVLHTVLTWNQALGVLFISILWNFVVCSPVIPKCWYSQLKLVVKNKVAFTYSITDSCPHSEHWITRKSELSYTYMYLQQVLSNKLLTFSLLVINKSVLWISHAVRRCIRKVGCSI